MFSHINYFKVIEKFLRLTLDRQLERKNNHNTMFFKAIRIAWETNRKQSEYVIDYSEKYLSR